MPFRATLLFCGSWAISLGKQDLTLLRSYNFVAKGTGLPLVKGTPEAKRKLPG